MSAWQLPADMVGKDARHMAIPMASFAVDRGRAHSRVESLPGVIILGRPGIIPKIGEVNEHDSLEEEEEG